MSSLLVLCEFLSCGTRLGNYLEIADEVLVLDALDDFLGRLLAQAHLVADLCKVVCLLLAHDAAAQRL